MDIGGIGFVLAIIAISYGAWVINTMIRAKHGYPLENEFGGFSGKDDQKTRALETENAELKAELADMRKRVETLERVVTDPVKRLENDIDNLRH